MPINKGEEFTLRDIYINHPYEEVMFRWDYIKKKIYRKFYGEAESSDTDMIEHSNRLFNDALLYGNEISKDVYLKGENV
jgi:hypothetical protein